MNIKKNKTKKLWIAASASLMFLGGTTVSMINNNVVSADTPSQSQTSMFVNGALEKEKAKYIPKGQGKQVQYIDYQAKNLLLLDGKQYFILGKTKIELTPRGASNTVSVLVNGMPYKSDKYGIGTYDNSSAGQVRKDTTWIFTLPQINGDVSQWTEGPKVSYAPDDTVAHSDQTYAPAALYLSTNQSFSLDNSITDVSQSVTGKANANEKIILKDSSGVNLIKDNDSITADSNGNYTITLNRLLKYNEEITAIAMNADNSPRTLATTIVGYDSGYHRPKVNTITAGTLSITGTVIPGDEVTATFNGRTIDSSKITVDAGGNYTISFDSPLETTDNLSITSQLGSDSSKTSTLSNQNPDFSLDYAKQKATNQLKKIAISVKSAIESQTQLPQNYREAQKEYVDQELLSVQSDVNSLANDKNQTDVDGVLNSGTITLNAITNISSSIYQGIQKYFADENYKITDRDTEDFRKGFNGAKEGYSSNSNNTQSDDKQQTIAYDYAKGIKDALSSQNPRKLDDRDQHIKSFKAGYNDTLDGINKALDKDNTIDANNQAQVKGYNEVKNGAAANDESDLPSHTEAYKKGYTESKNGYNDALESSKEAVASDTKSKIYQDSYNQTRAPFQAQIDYLTNRSNNNQYTGDNATTYNESYSGMTDAISDYNGGTTKSLDTLKTDNKSQQYKDSYRMMAVTQEAMADVVGQKDAQNRNYSDTEKTIYQKAFDAATSAKNSNNYSEQRTDSLSADYAYNTILGAKAYANGQANNGSQNFKDGYTQAQKGYKAESQVSRNPAYTYGQKSKSQSNAGESDYQNHIDKKDGQDVSYGYGYDGSKDGNEDAVVGHSSAENSGSWSSKPQSYQDSYKNAYTKGSKVREGMQDDLASKDAASKSDSDYMSGYNGVKDGLVSKSGQSQSNQDAKYVAAYNYAQGVQAALSNPNGIHNNDSATNKAYQAGYNDTQDGIKSSMESGTLTNDSKKATAKGFNEINNGAKAYQSGQNNLTNKTEAYKKGFNEAKTGHDDAQKSKSDDVNGSHTVQYKTSFQLAKAGLQGISDFLNSGKQVSLDRYNNNDIEKQSYQDGFSGAKAGQTVGMSGRMSDNSNNSQSYKDGYKTGYDKGFSSYLSDVQNQQAAYMMSYRQGINQAAQDFENGVAEDFANKSQFYIDGYKSLASNAVKSTVSYEPGYGVLVWNIVDGKPVQTKVYKQHHNKIYTTKETKKIEGISYTKLAATDNNWIQTKYLTENPSTPLTGVLAVRNVPTKNYAVYLRDTNGKMTDQKVYLNSSWRVFEQKQINGQLYYRIGNDNQWIEAKYANLG